jgi:hypothetical protein
MAILMAASTTANENHKKIATEGYRAVLLVSGHRDDRRVLFNTFDALGYDAVYTARETQHARALLNEDPKIGLIALDFSDPNAASTWCETLGDATLWVFCLQVLSLISAARPKASLSGCAAPCRRTS